MLNAAGTYEQSYEETGLLTFKILSCSLPF
ncbi:hypothetical protein BH09BAC6_BH09BAC6_00650 [soil metagenome]|jgi:hypothetical protein